MDSKKKNTFIASLITIHAIQNFGSSLQTIATCNILRNLGIKPLVINYIRPRDRLLYLLFDIFKEKSVFLSIKLLFIFPYKFYIQNKFDKYLKKYCILTKPIYTNDDFLSKCPKTDFYITGSDQVWNVQYNGGVDTRYFWQGIKGPKISFASSLGNCELTEDEKKNYPTLLSDYKAISVRESSAKKSLEDIGFHVTHVLDPTMMFNRYEWQQYASPRLVKQPYIYVYLPYNTENIAMIYKSIRKIAAKRFLKVVTSKLSSFSKERYADETFCFCNPSDFISLMTNAEYVVTSSFHGAAFAINLNKQFWVYMPSKFSSRISSIINLCGLQTRILTSEIMESQIYEVIDYNQVNAILENERDKTMDFLKEALL